MLKIISKETYDNLCDIIEMENRQIEELIRLATKEQENAKRITKYYCDLMLVVNKHIKELPEDAKQTISDIYKTFTDDR